MRNLMTPEVTVLKRRFTHRRETLTWWGGLVRWFNWVFRSRAFCPICGQVQTWDSRKCAYIEDDGTPDEDKPIFLIQTCTVCAFQMERMIHEDYRRWQVPEETSIIV